jgi:hypothetical protein
MSKFWRFWGFLILFLNSRALAMEVHNPLSIPGLQEVMFLLLLFYTFMIYLPRFAFSRQQMPVLDWVVLGMTLATWMLPPLFAWLRFGQPYHFGLLEDRIALNMLVYFPLVRLVRTGVLDAERIMRYVVLSTTIVFAYMWLIKMGIAPRFKTFNYSQYDTLRADRMNTAVYYTLFSSFICIAWGNARTNIKYYFYSFFFCRDFCYLSRRGNSLP